MIILCTWNLLRKYLIIWWTFVNTRLSKWARSHVFITMGRGHKMRRHTWNNTKTIFAELVLAQKLFPPFSNKVNGLWWHEGYRKPWSVCWPLIKVTMLQSNYNINRFSGVMLMRENIEHMSITKIISCQLSKS